MSSRVAPPTKRGHLVRDLARFAVVAIAYWAAARLSLHLALVRGQVTPIWPPTGIALVTFLLLGTRVWPAIFVAAFAVNLPIGPSPLGAAIIAVGNTLAPLASTQMLRRQGFRTQLDRMRDAVAIVVLGALVGMTISATIGSAVLTLSGAVPLSSFASTWAVWWAGDAMGVLLVAPMLLSLIPRPGMRPLGWRRSIELTLLLAGVGVAAYFLFENPFHLEYLVLPLIAIAAWRYRLAGAAPAALIASLIAVWAAVNGTGPFASENLFQKMITLQAFNVSLSLASFLLAAYADAYEQREEIARMYQSARHAISTRTDAVDVAARDLGPPVALITSYLAVLSEGKLGPPPRKWRAILNVMADKAWQVDRIITELVDAAHIEAKSQASVRSHVDLREAVEKAAQRAGPRAEISGARVVTTYGKQPVLVDVDARQLGRILDNLINNSLTYSVRPARVHVKVVPQGNRAVIRVIDNGVGIADADQAHVFEPFRRTKDPAFSESPGAGLGLFASRTLAEANGGTLALERSETGVGSTFVLELPLAPGNGSH